MRGRRTEAIVRPSAPKLRRGRVDRRNTEARRYDPWNHYGRSWRLANVRWERKVMLLWEVLRTGGDRRRNRQGPVQDHGYPAVRLPFDTRCAAITKSGRRCKGRIRQPGGEFCFFHDPVIALHRKTRHPHQIARRRLMRLPDGYLRKLSDIRSVGTAMDRLYREIRVGAVTLEMGRVLYTVLSRLADAPELLHAPPPKAPLRTRAHKLRAKMDALLTRSEKSAWRTAVVNAPPVYLHTATGKQPLPAGQKPKEGSAAPSTLTAAS